MKVLLPPDLERRIAETVKSGRYASASEVVQESLRLLFEAEEGPRSRLDRLRQAIDHGIAQLDRGDAVPGDSVLAEITERLDRRRGA
jgi:antitoxin ParD1/3/4